MGLEGVEEASDPADVAVGVGRPLRQPRGHQVDVVGRVPVGERHGVLRHPGHRPAEGEEGHRRHGRGDLLAVFDDDADDFVGQRPQLVRLPVVVAAVGHGRVERLLVGGVGLGHDGVDHRGRELAKGLEDLFTLGHGSRIGGDEGHDGLAVQLGGDHRQGRSQAQVPHQPHFVGRVGDEVPEEPEDGRGLVHRPDHHAGQHRRPQRLQLEGEVGHDAEVAPAAPQAPEQVGVLFLVGHHELAVGGDDVARAEGVDGEAELAHEVADAAAQRQAADAGVADEAAGGGQPEGLALPVEMGVEAAALGLDGAGVGVDSCAGHGRQVDDQAVVADPVAGHRMASAPDRGVEAQVTAEADGGDHVGHARTAGDERRPALDVAVPDLAGLVVRRVVGGDQPALEAGGQGFDRVGVDAWGLGGRHGVPPADLVRTGPMCQARPHLASTNSVLVRKCLHRRGMPTYGQFRPVAMASEILTERWTPATRPTSRPGSHPDDDRLLDGPHRLRPRRPPGGTDRFGAVPPGAGPCPPASGAASSRGRGGRGRLVSRPWPRWPPSRAPTTTGGLNRRTAGGSGP